MLRLLGEERLNYLFAPIAFMKVPINYPSDPDVIREEVARFRALSPEERMRAIRGVLAAGWYMLHNSPNAAFLRRYAAEQEELGRQRIKEFIARHAPKHDPEF